MNTGARNDDFESVLRTMRERLDGVSNSIANALARIDWEAEKAPVSLRISARAAAAEIANTQDWLRQRLQLLPFDPQQRYMVLQDLLQSQFVALEKITSIVRDLLLLRDKPVAPEYLPPGMRSQAQIMPPLEQPRALEPPFARDFTPQAPIQFPTEPQAPPSWGEPMPNVYQGWDPPPHQYDYASAPQQAPVHLADLEPVTQTQPITKPTRGKGRKKRKEEDYDDLVEEETTSSTRRLLVRALALFAALVFVAGTAYFAYSRFFKQKGPRTAATKSERVAIGDPSARGAAQKGNGAAPVRRVEPGSSRVPAPPPMSAPPLEEAPSSQLPGVVMTMPTPPPVVQAPVAPVAPVVPAPARTAPAAPATAPSPPAARITGGDGQFVPLIGTHRDRNELMAMLADLRRQYPDLIGKRQSDTQTINFGDKGVWHQLILLPPMSRQQATATCNELRAAGYSRCSVRPY